MKFHTLISFIFIYSQVGFGQTNFREHLNTPFIGVNRFAVDIADVDGDGDIDILYCGKTNTSFSISHLYLNDGYGNYSLKTNTNFPKVYNSIVKFSDIDNDNDMDVLFGGIDDQNNWYLDFYINDGLGNFTKKNQIDLPILKWMHGTFGDIDGDSDEDLFISGKDSNNLNYSYLYRNNGVGDFTQDTLVISQNYVSGFKLIDINNDSDLDLYIKYSNSMEIFENDGQGNFTSRTLTNIPTNKGMYSWGDFNNDSLIDVTVSNLYPNSLTTTTFYNLGNYNFQESIFGASGFEHTILYWADINVDGYNDMLITGYYKFQKTYKSIVYYGDGTDYLVLDASTTLPAVNYGTMIFADVDNDSDPDLFMIGLENQNFVSKLFINDVIISSNEISNPQINSQIFPNPTTGTISIKLPSNSNTTIKIFNSTGQLIFQQTDIESDTYKFNFNAPSGIYIVEVNSDETKQQFKLIKN